jgi:hypothetical protein
VREKWNILVSFGIKGHRRTTSREVNLFTSHDAQVGGGLIIGIMEIQYYPWCGEEIDIVRHRAY